MKILVVGSGAREHALIWKLKQSPKVKEIFCAPGNAGIAQIAKIVDIKADDIDKLVSFAKENQIDLTVVGPEDPLVKGIVDQFEKEGLKVFGPNAEAAQLEGSKAFSKNLMFKYGIPTAPSKTFINAEEAIAYINTLTPPIVVKADGLAAGKGVIVAQTKEEATDAIKQIMLDKVFKEAGAKVVIEEFLAGEEASIIAFSDGNTVVPMVSAQDHKPIFDGDKGPNTGGMGSYSPAPVVTKEMMDIIQKDILDKTVEGLRKEGIIYKGFLYAGLMITDKGPKVIEFNVRFGDPETQVILPRLKTDLVDILEATIENRLDQIKIEWTDDAAVGIVLASEGYPGDYPKGLPISGLDQELKNTIIFHAGTALKDGKIVTSGGRVLTVTSWGKDIPSAIEQAYESLSKISFQGMQYRKDIGQKALKYLL